MKILLLYVQYVLLVNSNVAFGNTNDDRRKGSSGRHGPVRTLKSSAWTVVVYTGTEDGAGTDSKIEIAIHGTNGYMSRRRLSGGFENSDTDRTNLTAYFGKPYAITIYHDGRGSYSGWRLKKVTLADTHATYYFYCNCWINDETKYISSRFPVCKDIPHCKVGSMHCYSSPDNSDCSLCDDPYYASGGRCQLCSSIDQCTDRYCTSYSNAKCRRCQHNNIFFKLSPDQRQCDRMCAWNNHYCWPGTCAAGIVDNCQCSTGFQLISSSSETSCQLSVKPSIETCSTTVTGSHGEKKASKSTGPTTECQFQADFFGRFTPVSLQYDLTAEFKVDTSQFHKPRPQYIFEENFGVTDVRIQVILRSIQGPDRQLSNNPFLTDNSNSANVTSQFYKKGTITNHGNRLINGDSLCLKYAVYGGGFLVSIDTSKDNLPQSQPTPYQKTMSSRSVCYRYDDTPPQHCLETSSCTIAPLTLETRISRTPNIEVSWQGWFDPIPSGGNKSHASSIESFQVSVNEVIEIGNALKIDLAAVFTKTVNANVFQMTLNISANKPRLYCVSLEVKDIADNVGQARRFFLYDNTTSISSNPNYAFYISSASENTNYTWQTNHKDVCLNWTNYFINEFYARNKLLGSIQPAPNNLITGVYEQNDGILPVKGTTNINGIIKFLFSFARGNTSFSIETNVPDFPKQTFCKAVAVKDGETFNLRIRAIDIVSNSFYEDRTVHFDRSVPNIENIWLVKDGYRKLFVHDQIDLSKMDLQFDAFDPHSGIETVEWYFGLEDYSDIIHSGAIGVPKQNQDSCLGVENCYCPMVGSACEIFRYSIPLIGLVNASKHIGNHNRNYFFTVKVTNMAKLFNIEHMEILVDDSPPETGIVLEGPTGYPDIDYTSEDTFLVNWHGFIDHESGIKLYRIALASHCLSKVDLYEMNENKTNAVIVELSYPANIVRLPANFSGQMYVTVIALNNAMDPSEPACSDGISKDNSPPTLRNITLLNARWSESIYCHDNITWFLRSDLVKLKLPRSVICNRACNSQTALPFIESIISRSIPMRISNESIPKEESIHGEAEFLCSEFSAYDSNIIYLPNDRIVLTWSVEEDISQIDDFYIGFGKTISEKHAPGLVQYVSTNKKTSFKIKHSGIGLSTEFFVFLKVINKAGLEHVTSIGPVLIDQTPPLYQYIPEVKIEGDNIVIGWKNNTFYDDEQSEDINQIMFQIGHKGGDASPLLEWRKDSSAPCPKYTGGCFRYPLAKLQRQDTDIGLRFHVSLYIYNNAGHSTELRTREFSLPSTYPPGHAVVFDVDPETNDVNLSEDRNDIDSHFTLNTVCFKWKGFDHHEQLKFEIGIGTSRGRDDIRAFISSNNTDRQCIIDPVIPVETKLFVSVRVSCSGGSTISSSDGVTIFNPSNILTGLIIRDGPKCVVKEEIVNNQSQTGSSVMTFNTLLTVGQVYTLRLFGQNIDNSSLQYDKLAIYVKNFVRTTTYFDLAFQPYTEINTLSLSYIDNVTSIYLYDCEDDTSAVVTGNVIKAHWTRLSSHFFFETAAVQLLCPDANNETCMDILTPFTTIRGDTSTNAVTLKPKNTYYVAVKPCLLSKCLQLTLSSGVYVEPHKLTIRILKSNLFFHDSSHSNISLEWEPIGDVNVSFYQWTVSSRDRTTNSFSEIMGWKTLSPASTTHIPIKVQACIQLPVHPFKNLFICVRAYTEAGQKVQSCAVVNHASDYNSYKMTVYDLDATSPLWTNILQVVHSRYLGDRLSVLHDQELDFGTTDTRVVGVIPNGANRNITWSLTTDPEGVSCEKPTSCKTSLTTATGYVEFPKQVISFNTIYYICASSNESHIERETFTENLPSIQACSNGFVIDNGPPSPGKVQVENVNGYINNLDEVVISWSGFEDNIDAGVLGYDTNISSYTVEIGSSPSEKNIKVIANIRYTTILSLGNLPVEPGTSVFVSVVAFDHTGLSTKVSSEELIVDTTPPIAGHVVSFQLIGSKWVSDTILAMQFFDFIDDESGIDYFVIHVGSARYKSDVLPETIKRNDVVELPLRGINIIDGHIYYVGVKAVNSADLSSEYVFLEFGVDRSSPTGGHVLDGPATKGAIDRDFQTDVNHINSHWRGFTDPHSGIAYYRASLGTYPFGHDTEPMINVGLLTDFMWNSTFTPGQRYYVTVEACNSGGLCRVVTSDGVVLDDSPPVPGLVRIGSSSQHQTYIPQNSSIEIFWIGFEDPESGMQRYEACIGTLPGLCNVVPMFNCLLASNLIKNGLNMPTNTYLFATVVGYNKNNRSVSAFSRRFIVDLSPPELLVKPTIITNYTSFNSFDGQWEKSILRLTWEFFDSESPILRHIVTFSTHHEGHTPVENVELGHENKLTINLDGKNWLHDGDTYSASVTACNSAGHCSTALSDTILIDSTPPHMGGFKPPMVWQNFVDTNKTVRCIVNLTWYGFHDQESGLKKFYIGIGKTFTGNELSDGLVETDASISAGQFKTSIVLKKPLARDDKIVASVLAENRVGLTSSISRVTLFVLDSSSTQHVENASGILEIEKHSCDVHFCNKDCTCAVVGKVCTETVNNLTCNAVLPTPNTLFNVSVRVYSGTEKNPENVTASSSCMSAYWLVDEGISKVLRFEWTIGIKDGKAGEGIFDLLYERPWIDNGRRQFGVYCLPINKTLRHGEEYTIYVKVWVEMDSFLIFTSLPIMVDHTPPGITRGKFVIDSDRSCGQDVDFIDWTDQITSCWERVFNEHQGRIIYYTVGLGTAPGADDILERNNVGMNTTFTATGLDLTAGNRYYFSVTAFNNVGLHTSVTSDGFVVDLDKPVVGVVYNTKSYRNYAVQSSKENFHLSWQGFTDHDSGIKSYLVALIEDLDNKTLVVDFVDVLLRTSVTLNGLNLEHGKKYYAAVKAIDAAGHISDVKFSDPKLVDVSAPTQYWCPDRTILHHSFVRNSSDFLSMEFQTHFDIGKVYIVTGSVTGAVQHLQIKFTVGSRVRKLLPLETSHDGAVHFHFSFYSNWEATLNIKLETDSYMYDTAEFALSKCEISTTVDPDKAVMLKQLSTVSYKASVRVMDQESGIKKALFGLGTTPTGFQLKSLYPIDVSTDEIFSMYIPHGTSVYATAIVENFAGLRSVFRSKELAVDHTPPLIENILASVVELGLKGSNEDSVVVNGTIIQLRVQWNVTDPESGIKMCFVAIGSKAAKEDIQKSILAIDGTTFLTDRLYVAHGQKLFASVKCVNSIEYSTSKVSKPIIISVLKPRISRARLWFVPSKETGGFQTPGDVPIVAIQSAKTHLQFGWEGFEDRSGISFYEYRISSDGAYLTEWTNAGSKNFVTYVKNKLVDGQNYTAEVRAVNPGNMRSEVVTSSILVESREPRLTGHSVEIHTSNRTVSLNWENVFDVNSLIPTYFDVLVGSAEGFVDITERLALSDSIHTFVVPQTSIESAKIDEIFISISAIYATGRHSAYKTSYKFPI